MRRDIRNCLGACICLVAAAGFSVSLWADETRRIRLGGRSFEIPERYFKDSEIPAWLRGLRGLDDGSRTLLLTIDAAEVAAAVPGFKPTLDRYVDNMQLQLFVPQGVEFQRLARPYWLLDIWNSTGSYSERRIETDPETNFVRVYRRIEYPYSWEVLTISPDKPMPDDLYSFWIGHCLTGSSPLTSTGSISDCTSHVVAAGVSVHFRTNEQNLAVVNRIREYLAGLALQWSRGR